MPGQPPLDIPGFGVDPIPGHTAGRGPIPASASAAQERDQAPAPHRAAARGYNELYFEGRLAQDPVLRPYGNNHTYCRVDVLQDQPDRNGQPGTQAISVVCFNERANRFAERFRKGDAAVFVGRIVIERRRDAQGQIHFNVSLHLDYVLGHRPARRGPAATPPG
jgi:hypothetical protein